MKRLKISRQKTENSPLLSVNDWANIKRWMNFVKPGRWVKIVFSVVYYIRSPDQNAWYWTQCTAFADEYGWNSPEEVHEYFKSLFLKKRYTLPNGQLCETIGSTTDLTTVSFKKYVEKCRVHSYHECSFKWEDPKPKNQGQPVKVENNFKQIEFKPEWKKDVKNGTQQTSKESS